MSWVTSEKDIDRKQWFWGNIENSDISMFMKSECRSQMFMELYHIYSLKSVWKCLRRNYYRISPVLLLPFPPKLGLNYLLFYIYISAFAFSKYKASSLAPLLLVISLHQVQGQYFTRLRNQAQKSSATNKYLIKTILWASWPPRSIHFLL